MSTIVYLNGQYLPLEQAAVSVRDRGFIFADGVYEVVRYYGGRPLAMAAHLDRLALSLTELRIELPADATPFDEVSDELVRSNGHADGQVYWQVTRGSAAREHKFPDPPARPTIYAASSPLPPLDPAADPPVMRAITHPEIRWTRAAIKSIALLPNVLARQAAADAGCDEAIFVRADGTVTEATARSVFIVDGGELWTHPLDGRILGSITRKLLIELAVEQGLTVHEQPFDAERMLAAAEVIVCGTTTEVRAVGRIDDRVIGDGSMGPLARRLSDAFRRHVAEACGLPG